jgi:hypothetical protein
LTEKRYDPSRRLQCVPRELEEVIMTHPAVSLCAVIGVPDSRLGEEIKAFLVLKEGAELSDAAFIDWCRKQFAANKYPSMSSSRQSSYWRNRENIQTSSQRRNSVCLSNLFLRACSFA